ncbi:MAG: Rieske 2Fe-2S domain-containing protein [Thermoplasmata archaeon]
MNVGCPSGCPFVAAREPMLDFPVGQLRRLAPTSPAGGDVDETKRNLIKLLAVAGVIGAAGGGLVGGSLQFVQPPTIGISSYPKVQLLDLDGSNLTVTKAQSEYNSYSSQVFTFFYPLLNEPNFFLNLAPPATGGIGATDVVGGVGDQKSIVAFSAICQHLGCPAPAISYYPPGTCPQTPGGKQFYIHCTCHGSTYDVTNGASNLTGPAVLPLPQVTLDVINDNIYAIGVTGPPVNGHLDTLQGDYGVGSTSQIQRQAPIVACNIM